MRRRTAWGDPDLQGVWDYRTITPLERPTDLAHKEFLTEEEAATRNESAVERESRLAARKARRAEVDPSGNIDRGVDGAPGSYNAFWFDRGCHVRYRDQAHVADHRPAQRADARA